MARWCELSEKAKVRATAHFILREVLACCQKHNLSFDEFAERVPPEELIDLLIMLEWPDKLLEEKDVKP